MPYGKRELTEKSDIVVPAEKPQHARSIRPEVIPALTKDKCLVSIAAGLTQEDLRRGVDGIRPAVRTMPNGPALIGKGVTAVCFDAPGLTDRQKEDVRAMFHARETSASCRNRCSTSLPRRAVRARHSSSASSKP